MKIKRTDWETALLVLPADDPLVRRIGAKLQAVDTDHVAFRVSRVDRRRVDEAIAIGRLRIIQAAGVLGTEGAGT